jgi:hypothetical protein
MLDEEYMAVMMQWFKQQDKENHWLLHQLLNDPHFSIHNSTQLVFS